MRYNKVIDDPDFFTDITAYRMARLINVHESYMYKIKNGDLIVSEKQYLRFREAKRKYLTKDIDLI